MIARIISHYRIFEKLGEGGMPSLMKNHKKLTPSAGPSLSKEYNKLVPQGGGSRVWLEK